MIKQIFKLLITFLCASLFISQLYVSADSADGTITVDTVNAIPNDVVIVNFNIDNNPGIAAMTISITYDSSVLTYEKFYQGNRKDNMLADHPNKNIIRYVTLENDNNTNGILFSLQFKVSENAEIGFSKISISYKSGDFCNYELKRFMPEIISGGVNVAYNGKNCSHQKYSDWAVVAEPKCIEKGAEQRSCEKCGHAELRDVKPTGHSYSDKWTIDEAATPEKDGTMSKHCKNCDATTEILTFKYVDTKKEKIDNTDGAQLPPSDYTDKLLEEQKPDSEIPKNDTQSGSNTEIKNNDEQKNETSYARTPIEKVIQFLPNYKKFLKYIIAATAVILKLIIL